MANEVSSDVRKADAAESAPADAQAILDFLQQRAKLSDARYDKQQKDSENSSSSDQHAATGSDSETIALLQQIVQQQQDQAVKSAGYFQGFVVISGFCVGLFVLWRLAVFVKNNLLSHLF